MSDALTAGKRHELRVDSRALHDELDDWLAASAAGQALENHHSQVRTLDRLLRGLSTGVDVRASKPTIGLDDAASLETEMLALHGLWDFFRSKLAIRCVPWLREPLEAVDELAWACYRPALAYLAPEQGAEPPLVFPNSVASPFTIPRGARFRLAIADEELLDAARLADALEFLPIPVIGIPWLQGGRLLGALVVGHEVGHDIEHALGLAATVDALIARRVTDPERRGAWLQWRAEVFADVYGTLACGPAFTAALTGFLTGERRAIEGRRLSPPMFGDYPTRPLRVRLSIATLRRLGFDGHADRLWDEWTATYPGHAMPEYEPDVDAIVACVVDGPHPRLGGAPLTDVLTFTANMQRSAEADADRLRAGVHPRSGDVRVLFAAARLAFARAPEEYLGAGGPAELVRSVRALRGKGTRAARETDPAERLEARDAAAARRVQEVISQIASSSHPSREGADDVQAQAVS